MKLSVATKVFQKVIWICYKHLEEISWKSSLQSKSLNLNLLKLALAKIDPFLIRNCETHNLHCSVRSVLRTSHAVQTSGTEGSSRHDAWGIPSDNMYPRTPCSSPHPKP